MLGPLPPMFLRIPPGTDARIDLSLEMDDDRIATFLQNEEFMAELRWNQEFMAALDSEQGQKTKCHDDEAAFKERLKNMGKCEYLTFTLVPTCIKHHPQIYSWEIPKYGPTYLNLSSKCNQHL